MNLTNLRKQVATYEKSTTKDSVWQYVTRNSVFSVMVSCLSMLVYFLYFTFTFNVAAAGFLVRIFIIFHDCWLHSFFKNRLANKILGTITGVLTLFPYDQWAHEHSVHHATSSNLDKRGVGHI